MKKNTEQKYVDDYIKAVYDMLYNEVKSIYPAVVKPRLIITMNDDNSKSLGRFNVFKNTIEISRLLYNVEHLDNILLHELAHVIAIKLLDSAFNHGPIFRVVCDKIGCIKQTSLIKLNYEIKLLLEIENK